jgi:hypothetical protein
MRTLNDIKTELEVVDIATTNVKRVLYSEAMEVMDAKLKGNEKLKELIQKLESSRDLTNECEFPARFIRFNPGEFIDVKNEFEREVFETYLSDSYFARVDFHNDCLVMEDGPCIIINEDGDVLDQDSGKWIISKTEYATKRELFSLINAWTEKSGYFPSIVRADRYGNLFYVDANSENSDE